MRKKKSLLKKRLKVAFWLVFLLGCLWVAFAPHTNIFSPSVTIKVQQPSLPPELFLTGEMPPVFPLPSGGEELTPPEIPLPQNGSITVPVLPEAVEPLPPGHPIKIAIVIDDMGSDLKSTERAVQLPAPITLSFLPFSIRAREQAKEAREKGHEILLHMPMEPIGRESPGAGALLVNLPLSELHLRLEAALSNLTGFDGINNHMGSKFTSYREGMDLVMNDLLERGLFFLDSRTSAKSIAMDVAKQKGLPAISRDVFLDDDPSPEAIRKQLKLAEHIARRKGFAVAIGHPHSSTINVLEAWAAEAPQRGIELVPINNLIVGKKGASSRPASSVQATSR